jgi:hypothetical protein
MIQPIYTTTGLLAVRLWLRRASSLVWSVTRRPADDYSNLIMYASTPYILKKLHDLATAIKSKYYTTGYGSKINESRDGIYPITLVGRGGRTARCCGPARRPRGRGECRATDRLPAPGKPMSLTLLGAGLIPQALQDGTRTTFPISQGFGPGRIEPGVIAFDFMPRAPTIYSA